MSDNTPFSGMVDLHSHLIAGVDDGSEDLARSLECLYEMQNAGTTAVCCTPHHLPGGWDTSGEAMRKGLQDLQRLATEASLSITLHQGMEVYLTDSSAETISREQLSLGGSHYVLVETGMAPMPADFYNNAFAVARKGFKPILAHPERYPFVYNNPALAEELIHRNFYLQINAGSLLGESGPKVQNAAWHLVYHGWAHFVASDYHTRGGYHLATARQALADEVDEYTADLLTRINPGLVLKDQSIERFYLEEELVLPRRGFWQTLKNRFRRGR